MIFNINLKVQIKLVIKKKVIYIGEEASYFLIVDKKKYIKNGTIKIIKRF